MANRRTPKLERWVVKTGSNIVCSGGPMLIRSWMQQAAKLRHDHKIELIWVTSGAIATGVERTHFRKRKKDITEKQALSAIGQPLLMDLYDVALHSVGLLGGQILLTSDDIRDEKRRTYLQNTLKKLLSWKVLPIINENDTTATEEIRFGDNDALSARVACVMRADRLVLMTDVEGLYDSDPKKNPDAELIHHVPALTPALLGLAGKGAGSSRGTGGMESKLAAAQLATKNGIETWLVKGDTPSVLLQIAARKKVGTRIEGRAKK